MTPWTVAHQAPPSVGFFQGTILEWAVISFTRVSSWPRDRTWVSHIAGRPFTIWTTRERLRADFHPSWDLKGWALFHTLLPCSGASISWRETFYPPQFLCLAYSIIIHLMTIGSVVISHFTTDTVYFLSFLFCQVCQLWKNSLFHWFFFFCALLFSVSLIFALYYFLLLALSFFTLLFLGFWR